MNKNKMKQDNRLYKIEIREVDKGKKRIKIHYKSLSERTNRWVASLWFFIWLRRISPCAFTFCTSISFRSSFPSVQQLCLWFSCCLARTSISRLQSWNFIFEDVSEDTAVNKNIANTRFFKNSLHDRSCGGLVTDFCRFSLP